MFCAIQNCIIHPFYKLVYIYVFCHYLTLQMITRPWDQYCHTWWCDHMETFTALLALYEGNTPVTSGFLSKRPVTRSLAVLFDVQLIKPLRKQSRRWWFGTPWRSSWRYRNGGVCLILLFDANHIVHVVVRGQMRDLGSIASDFVSNFQK